MPTMTKARDAEIIFHPQSSERERGDAVAELLRLAALAEHPAVLELAVYDDCRDVELAETPEPLSEPAFTVIGRYRDNDQTYVTTVYTWNGPKAAATLAREACSEDSDIPLDELDLEIVAIFEGEPEVAARGDEEAL